MSASDEVINGWRECADPVELAAAVAAGVEVQCVAVDGRTWETGCEDSESFRRCMANDCRYRVPSSWEWEQRPTDPGDACAERAKSKVPEVPEGHEVVVLPSGVVDEWVQGWAAVLGDDHRVSPEAVDDLGHVVAACRAAVARRPKPEPRTERVPWWEAVGRECPHDGRIISASRVEGACTQVTFYGGGCMEIASDGTVEVLRDGAR